MKISTLSKFLKLTNGQWRPLLPLTAALHLRNKMYKKLSVKLPKGWKVTYDRIIDQSAFDESGKRDYSVSEDLFQAKLEQTEGKPLIVDIGFYQSAYKVYLVLEDKWDDPIEVVSCDTAIDAVLIAEKIARERT